MKHPYPIIGMSPGNSYFKDVEVRYLLQSVYNEFGALAILVADVPAASTFHAFGYSEGKGKTKARLKGNNLKNRSRRIAEELGIPEEKIHIVDWQNDIEENAEYQAEYKKIEVLYAENEEFRKMVRQTTKDVLANSERDIADIESATETAVHYLLSELAFLNFGCRFFDVDSVMYLYHKHWPIYEQYISGIFDGVPKPELQFRLAENPYETFVPLADADSIPFIEKDALSRILEKKVIHASFFHCPPAFIKGESYTGIFYEILERFADSLGVSVEYVEETGYGVIIDGLNTHRFDIFASTVWPTPERREKAIFSKPIYKSFVEMVVAEDSTHRIDEMNNPHFRLAVREDDISHSIAKRDYPKARLVFTPQLNIMDDMLEMVADNLADATFANLSVVKTYNQQHEKKLRIVDSISPVRVYLNTFMMQKEDTPLREALNTYIVQLEETGALDAMMQRYAEYIVQKKIYVDM